MILGIQIKAARALLRMSQLELQKKTGISIATLQNIENQDEKIKNTAFRTIKKIKDTLEAEGIEFIEPINEEDDDGCGVRLDKKKSIWFETKK